MRRKTSEPMTYKALKHCYSRYAVTMLVMIVAVQVTVVLLGMAARAWLAEYINDPFWRPIIQIAVNDLSCYVPPVLIFLVMLRKMPRGRHIPVDCLDPWEMLQGFVFCMGIGYFLIYLAAIPVALIETGLGVEHQDIVGEMSQQMPLWLTLLSFAVIAPVCEEVIFRRILLDRLRGLGDGSAVVLSGLAFGFFHMNFMQLHYAIVLGMIFAVIVLLTGSIRDTIIIHSLINASSVMVERLPDEGKMGYGMFLLFCIVVSLVMLVRERKKYHFETGDLPFTPRDKHRSCLRSVWFWIMVVVCVAGSLWVAFE